LKKAQLLDPWPAARALTSMRKAGATLAELTAQLAEVLRLRVRLRRARGTPGARDLRKLSLAALNQLSQDTQGHQRRRREQNSLRAKL
jgi:hypothetical protein